MDSKKSTMDPKQGHDSTVLKDIKKKSEKKSNKNNGSGSRDR